MLTRKTLLVLFLVFCRHGGSIFTSSVELTSAKRQKGRRRGKKMQTKRGPQRKKNAKKTKTNKRGRKTAKKAAPALVSIAPNAELGPTSSFWPTAGPQSSLPASSDELGETNFPLVATETTIDGDLVPVVCQRETNFGRVMGQAMLKVVPSADIALINCGDFQANILGRKIRRADVRRSLREKKLLIVLKFTASELLAHLGECLGGEPGITSEERDTTAQVSGECLRSTTSPSSVVTVLESKLVVLSNEEYVVVTTTSFLGANDGGNGASPAPMPGTLLFHTNVSTQDALEQHIIDVGVLNISDPPFSWS